MTLRLLDWPWSPYCIKARAILDYKGLPYTRVHVLGPAYFELLRRGRAAKVPALDLDGRLIEDSTEIAYALETLAPSPAILPADPRQRALCHALEDWSDEALYWPGLHFQWIDPEGTPLVKAAFGGSVLGTLALPLFRYRVRQQLRGQGTGRKAPEQIARDLERSLDAIEALLSPGPWLLGEGPYLCDFALLGQLLYLSRPPKSAPMLAARPNIVAFLARMKAMRPERS